MGELSLVINIATKNSIPGLRFHTCIPCPDGQKVQYHRVLLLDPPPSILFAPTNTNRLPSGL